MMHAGSEYCLCLAGTWENLGRAGLSGGGVGCGGWGVNWVANMTVE